MELLSITQVILVGWVEERNPTKPDQQPEQVKKIMNYESEGCEARSNLNYELPNQSCLHAQNKELFFFVLLLKR